MPDLDFQIESARALTHSATPSIAFQLRANNQKTDQRIQNVMLQCQIQIETLKRKYTPEEQKKLRDLFGEPERWSQTLRTTYWTTENVSIPAFTGTTVADLNVPCTFDFNIAATKYFAGLSDGEVPLSFLFSGTIFHVTDDGLQIDQISWSKESKFRLPVSVWQEMMNHYYPNGAWLRLRQDVFDQLFQYKVDHGIPTWEQAIEKILAAAKVDQPEEVTS